MSFLMDHIIPVPWPRRTTWYVVWNGTVPCINSDGNTEQRRENPLIILHTNVHHNTTFMSCAWFRFSATHFLIDLSWNSVSRSRMPLTSSTLNGLNQNTSQYNNLSLLWLSWFDRLTACLRLSLSCSLRRHLVQRSVSTTICTQWVSDTNRVSYDASLWLNSWCLLLIIFAKIVIIYL